MSELTQEPKPFDFGSAIEHGKQQTVSTEYKGIPIFIVPESMKLHSLEALVEKQLPRPYSLTQSVELLTHESFVEYFNRYATESSTIFVNDKDSSFTAILDYHDSPSEPAWKRHRVTYTCPKTKEWGNWTKSNNEKMDQETFALFIEDNLREIMEPNGADMLQIASSLKATNNLDFKSGLRLDNGQVQFTYVETIVGQAGTTGHMQIPEKIKLAIAPFLKGVTYEIEARFRYRIAQGGLTMWYTLIRPHAFVDDAFASVVKKVKETIAKGHMIHAVPPSASN